MDLSIKIKYYLFPQYSKMSSVHQNVLIYLKIPITMSLQKVMDVNLKILEREKSYTVTVTFTFTGASKRSPFRKREILHSYSDLYFYWS